MNVRLALNKYEESMSSACRRGKCKLNTAGLDNLAILDLDLFSKGTRADYLIFYEDKGIDIGVCEMKSRKLDASKIEEQLSASTDTALNIYHECFPEHTQYCVVPILIAKAYKSSSIYTRLGRIRIKIDGKKRRVMLSTCGDGFGKILNESRSADK